MVDSITNKSDMVRAIETELQRQGIAGVDVDALAAAIQTPATSDPAATAEGKRPEDLNSANDD